MSGGLSNLARMALIVLSTVDCPTILASTRRFPGNSINERPINIVSTPCPGRNNMRKPANRKIAPTTFFTMCPITTKDRMVVLHPGARNADIEIVRRQPHQNDRNRDQGPHEHEHGGHGEPNQDIRRHIGFDLRQEFAYHRRILAWGFAWRKGWRGELVYVPCSSSYNSAPCCRSDPRQYTLDENSSTGLPHRPFSDSLFLVHRRPCSDSRGRSADASTESELQIDITRIGLGKEVVITQGKKEWFMRVEVTPENSVVVRQEKEGERYCSTRARCTIAP